MNRPGMTTAPLDGSAFGAMLIVRAPAPDQSLAVFAPRSQVAAEAASSAMRLPAITEKGQLRGIHKTLWQPINARLHHRNCMGMASLDRMQSWRKRSPSAPRC